MKWRIVLTTLFVLTLFTGFAYLYVNAFVRHRQHAIILFVVNGLDLNTLNVVRQQVGPRPARSGESDDPLIGNARREATYRNQMLNLDAFWNVALLNIQQPGQPVPDEGANATALACGRRVQNGYVAVDDSNASIPSLIYLAEKAQRATGLVTTSSLVDPTPVAFYSSTKGTPDPYANASDLILYSGIDVVLGGGEQYFTPASATNELGRRDGRNLMDEAKQYNYTTVRTSEELNKVSTWQLTNVSTWQTQRIFGVFAPNDFYFSSLRPPDQRQPSLAEMTRVAISNLNNNQDYFLVVEHGLVARAAEQNFGKVVVSEVAEVDEAIQTAVDYAGPDALIIVTNSYSLGAVGPMAMPSSGDLAAATPTVDATGKPIKPLVGPVGPPPAAAWLTGPGGPVITQAQAAWTQQAYLNGKFDANTPGLLQPQPAFRFQTRAQPIAEPAWLASRGEGSNQLRGFLNNTDLFGIISEQF